MANLWDAHDVGHIFGPIKRYTRFVDFSKLILALLAAVLVVMVVIIPIRNSGENGARLVFSSIEKTTLVDKPKMLHLRYQGMDKNNQPYNVTADTGVQVSDDLIQLTNPQADITTKEGKWAAIVSKEAFLNSKAKQIDAKGSVDVFYDQGYEFTTEFMHVDIEQKTITSDLPVQGHGPSGTLTAQGGFIATQADNRIFFKGPVHTVVFMRTEP